MTITRRYHRRAVRRLNGVSFAVALCLALAALAAAVVFWYVTVPVLAVLGVLAVMRYRRDRRSA